jgi:hypothetical protein
VENPYFQYFCGEEFFQHRVMFNRSSLTRWRQRMIQSSSLADAAAPAHDVASMSRIHSGATGIRSTSAL